MPDRLPAHLSAPAMMLCSVVALAAQPVEQDIVIEMDAPASGPADTLIIEPAAGDPVFGGELLIIDDSTTTADGQAQPEPPPGAARESGWTVRLDDVRAEAGYFTASASPADRSLYGKIAASANWQPNPDWEIQLAARVDGFDESGDSAFTHVKGDYGDNFIRYRGEDWRLTLGTQTVIWGRLDEIPLSDRVSTADLTRFILDDLEDRRRANPMLRVETFLGSGKLDLAWLIDFRAAELPEQDSVWYPVNQREGRILGISRSDIAPAAVQNAVIVDDEPGGDGGFGARYTRSHSLADFGITFARTRQSIPYFRAAPGGILRAEYPRSWAYGADAAIDAAGATWRVELVYSSDNPVTRTDLSYTTTPAVSWGAGVEFHPGDGDTRINLQLVGFNLVDAPAVLDREEVYSFNGQIEVPFDRARWRAKLGFYAGLDDKDVYLNPEIAFLGWEPHEVYLSAHYFEGDERSLGGFHEDHDTIQLGWRASF